MTDTEFESGFLAIVDDYLAQSSDLWEMFIAFADRLNSYNFDQGEALTLGWPEPLDHGELLRVYNEQLQPARRVVFRRILDKTWLVTHRDEWATEGWVTVPQFQRFLNEQREYYQQQYSV